MTRLRLLFSRITRRRTAALLVAMSVMGAQVEIALPDSHDGDARVTHVADESSHEEPSPTPTDTHGSNPAHAVHVDHCAHAHVFASDGEPEVATAILVGSNAPITATPLLSSVAIPPHSRPPIA